MKYVCLESAQAKGPTSRKEREKWGALRPCSSQRDPKSGASHPQYLLIPSASQPTHETATGGASSQKVFPGPPGGDADAGELTSFLLTIGAAALSAEGRGPRQETGFLKNALAEVAVCGGRDEQQVNNFTGVTSGLNAGHEEMVDYLKSTS